MHSIEYLPYPTVILDMDTVISIEPLLTTQELSLILRLDKQTTKKLCRNGIIKASLISGRYRIPISSLKSYCHERGLEIISYEEVDSTPAKENTSVSPCVVTRITQVSIGGA
jgi:hypothetical protein